MIIMGQWTRVENNNEVFLRVTNHTGQAEKNLLGPAGIRTRDLRFTSPMYEDYCLDMEETRFCFEISNSPSTIIWRPAPNLTCSSVGRASD